MCLGDDDEGEERRWDGREREKKNGGRSMDKPIDKRDAMEG